MAPTGAAVFILMLTLVLVRPGVVLAQEAENPNEAIENPSPGVESVRRASPAATLPLEGRTTSGLRFRTRGNFDGPLLPLVLLHGNFDSMETWDPLLAELPGEVPVVVIELPGYGGSPALQECTPAAYTAALSAALAELYLPPVVLVGHSHGGVVASHLAAAHPQQVAHLVLLSAGFIDPIDRGDLLQAIAGVLGLIAQQATGVAPSEELRLAIRNVLLDAAAKDEIVDPELVDAYAERIAACQTVALQMSYNVWAGPEPAESLPVTAVWGWKDTWVSFANAIQLGGFTGTAPADKRHFFLLTDSGHLAHREQPADLARILSALAGLEDLTAIPPCLGRSPVNVNDNPYGYSLALQLFGGTLPPQCAGN
ncbi:MAG: alpha/beta fold hydrolase [Bradymonadales bacterium]|nr:alpha/beta fold hydrolase [Bradymonadales bacterium]